MWEKQIPSLHLQKYQWNTALQLFSLTDYVWHCLTSLTGSSHCWGLRSKCTNSHLVNCREGDSLQLCFPILLSGGKGFTDSGQNRWRRSLLLGKWRDRYSSRSPGFFPQRILHWPLLVGANQFLWHQHGIHHRHHICSAWMPNMYGRPRVQGNTWTSHENHFQNPKNIRTWMEIELKSYDSNPAPMNGVVQPDKPWVCFTACNGSLDFLP